MKNKGKYLKYGLHIAVVIGLVWAIVKYVNGQEVLSALQNFTYLYLPFMLAFSLGYFFLKALRFLLLTSPFAGDLSKWVILKAYISGQAMVLLPGGVAARAVLLHQAGIPVSESSVPIAFDSGWDQAAFLVGGLIAALWFPLARLPVLVILGVLTLIAVLLLVPATRNRLAEVPERIAERFDWTEQWHHSLEAFPRVLTKKIMVGSLLITAVAFVMPIGLLWLTTQGLLLEAPIPTLFLAFIIPTMLGRLVPIPGGFGITEVGMVSFLTATAQLNTSSTVAAVAIFRIFSIVVPAVLGAFVYFFFWKGEDEKQQKTGDEKAANPVATAKRRLKASLPSERLN